MSESTNTDLQENINMQSTNEHLDDEKAKKEHLQKLVDAGDTNAMVKLAEIYEHGDWYDYMTSLDLYHQAAASKNTRAMMELGTICKFQKAYTLMVYWYNKAYLNGEHYALGPIMRHHYQTENYEEAMIWVDDALKDDSNNPDALYFKGIMTLHGYGTKKDTNTAREYLIKAAEQNCKPAMITLGCIYRDGIGVPTDIKAAVEWFDKAEATGYICNALNPTPEEWIKDYLRKSFDNLFSMNMTEDEYNDMPEELKKSFHYTQMPENVYPDMKIMEDLGLDSLDAVEWIMAMEEELLIEIMDEEAEKFVTLHDVYDCLLGKFNQNSNNFDIENIQQEVHWDSMAYRKEEDEGSLQ